jgi:hypothetical protein
MEQEGKRVLGADELVALQQRIAKGQRIQQFMGSSLYKEDIEPFLNQIAEKADSEAMARRKDHPEVNFWMGVRHAVDFVQESLQIAAKDADLSADDIPEDQSPGIDQQ